MGDKNNGEMPHLEFIMLILALLMEEPITLPRKDDLPFGMVAKTGLSD